jgi:hypothetical protein
MMARRKAGKKSEGRMHPVVWMDQLKGLYRLIIHRV